jgi:hypothetical protein
MSLLRQFFIPERQFSFNPITNKLIIAGGVKNVDDQAGGVIIKAFKKIYGETPVDDNTNNVVKNIWQDRWLRKYATALIKKQWGQNLSKFQQVQLMGGVTMDGIALKAEAEAEIVALEEELKSTYEFPVGFEIG